MSAKPSLSQQITAVELGRAMMTGAASPSQKERAYAAPHAGAAVKTLEWLRDNEAGIRRGKEAIALLRRHLPELPDAVREEVMALLRDDWGAR